MAAWIRLGRIKINSGRIGVKYSIFIYRRHQLETEDEKTTFGAQEFDKRDNTGPRMSNHGTVTVVVQI
jgi:hypothetical protein